MTIEKNIYKRPDGRYEGRYIKARNNDGKAIYGAVYARTVEEVKEKRKRAIGELNTSTSPKYLITEVLKTHLAGIRNEVRPSTHAIYQGYFEKYISSYFKDMYYEELSAEKLQAFVDWILESGISAVTVQTILAFIKRGFESINEQNIFAVDLPNHTRHDIDYLSVEEQKRLEAAAKYSDETIHAAVILCLYTGLLVGELCGAEWSDIDFHNRLLYVNRTMQRIKNTDDADAGKTKLVFMPTQDASRRSIPLPQFLFDLLHKHKEASHSETYVLSKDGAPIEPRNIQRRLQLLLEEAGVRQTNFNGLRNTFAVRALENGIDIVTLSELLGHSTPEITMKRYGGVIKKDLKRQSMEKMVSLYES